ncbi:MAG: hypothetical protein OEY14_03985, partial [Myxococcales bacterium]|nr:hypothetical protein [Myxococcales bacterium]
MRRPSFSSFTCWFILAGLLSITLGCDGGGLPTGHGGEQAGSGPIVRWDLYSEDLPDIPQPNDFATWADPSSPTGLRINASSVAPTEMERLLRAQFDAVDGWGTYAPITVAFDTPIDTTAMIAAQGPERLTEADFQRHHVYLIDLSTGVPVPLDVNHGTMPLTLDEPDSYYSNDPHVSSSNLLFETEDEDLNGNGRLDPLEDRDWDGRLDTPNTIDGRAGTDWIDTLDRMLWFYERETNTLFLRPSLPLQPQTEYAVVITDRMVGIDGDPVRSPFEFAHHPAQREALEGLPGIFSARPHIYGDLASRGWEGISFAWTFTTQSTTGDLDVLREGLYGRGPFARLAEEFPATMTPALLRGGTPRNPCEPGNQVYIMTADQLRDALTAFGIDELPQAGGAAPGQISEVFRTLDAISHFAFAVFESPFLLGDPKNENVHDTWQMDRLTGEAQYTRGLVPIMITIPKNTAAHSQPFPVALYAHGYTSLNLESLAFSGLTAQHGIATVSIDAHGHGLPVNDGLFSIIATALAANCLEPFGRTLGVDRGADLNADGLKDNAGLFFSAYMFHTRDALRQTALDWLQATRIIRSFQGHPDYPEGRDWLPGSIQPPEDARPLEFTGDTNSDGEIDLAGDFDGDGIPDLGGWDRPYFQWGSSLGGIVSMIMMGIEPSIVAAAPVSGGGGLFDLGMRSNLGTAANPIWMRVMGPLVVSLPSGGPGDSTGCEAGERTLRFEVPDLNNRGEVAFACVPGESLDEGAAILVRNLATGEVRCGGAGAAGRFRVSVPTSEFDPLEIEIYADLAAGLDASDCTIEGDPEPSHRVDTWGLNHTSGTARAGFCRDCAYYHGMEWAAGDPLVAPIEGLGRPRQTPSLRRLAALSQIAVDPADPINYARRIFLDPPRASDVTDRTRNMLVMLTAGDNTVPVAGGYAYARAAGILPTLPPGAPDELAEYRSPSSFITRGYVDPENGDPIDNPTALLRAYHVFESIPRLDRHHVDGTTVGFAVDLDDAADGLQLFTENARRQADTAGGEVGYAPVTVDPPLRWIRQSRPMSSPSDDPFVASPTGGLSGVMNAMIVPRGNHVVL